MNHVRLTFDVQSLQLNHQHFFYLDADDNLKTTEEVWPELQQIHQSEELCVKANTLLLIMQFLVKEEEVIHISRESVSKKSRRIAKKAANLNELLRYLNKKGYISFQYAGVSGRKQFITINPKIFM
ncbi:hypothetical protein [Lysinibacillus capsici]|uniref:hypothetical protein n=1 Tax=Lysinibacillus capsici TaxID=2115968 RepID=UPI000E2022B5|nr:hypothetical protein [Lysinibacillus capsici]RDV35226.1 hypothetical protein C7B89_01520 [Lysinibacillus capsici]